MVYQDQKNPYWTFGVYMTEDGKYLVMYVCKSCSTVRYILLLIPLLVLMLFQQNLLWIANFDKNNIGPNIEWIKVVDEFVSEYTVYVSNHPIQSNSLIFVYS